MSLCLSFNNQDQYDKFLRMIESYLIRIHIDYLEMDFAFNPNRIPLVEFSFNDFSDKFFEVNSIAVYGGKFNDLNGLDTLGLNNVHFYNTYVKSIDGLGDGIRILDFTYNLPIESVTDWSNITNMKKLYMLTVDYTNWNFIGIEHLLHFNNIPEEILDVKEVNIINHDAFGKLRYFKNYIKNIFIEENPSVKGKLRSNIIRKLQGNYEPILHGRK